MAVNGSKTVSTLFGSRIEAEFRRLMRLSGLDKQWRIRVEQEAQADNWAAVSCLPEDRLVTLKIGVEEPFDMSPEDVARHEFLHVLFWNLVGTAAASKNAWSPLVLGEEHAVIQTLLSLGIAGE